MMINVIRSLCLVLLVGAASAEPIPVAEKTIEIRAPEGFTRVTDAMPALSRLSNQMIDPYNDQLAYYIADSDVPAALAGDIPDHDRYFLLKVNKKIKRMEVTDSMFGTLVTVTKNNNEKMLKEVEKEIPALLDKMSDGISGEFDLDVALKLSQVLPLPPHAESENTWAYSMFINFGREIEGASDVIASAATSTMVHVNGKVLFLYCYGDPSDLEWTRRASQAWADDILRNNGQNSWSH